MTRVGMKAGEAIEKRHADPPDRAGRSGGSSSTISMPANSCWNMTTLPNDQRRVDLSAANTISWARRDVAEAVKRDSRGTWSPSWWIQYVAGRRARGAVGTHPAWPKPSSGIFGPLLPIDTWLEIRRSWGRLGLTQQDRQCARRGLRPETGPVSGLRFMRYIEKRSDAAHPSISTGGKHLAAMDYMRQGIFLRSYAQKNSETGIQARGVRNCSPAMLDPHQVRQPVTTVVQDPSAQPGRDRARGAGAATQACACAAGAARRSDFNRFRPCRE